MTQKNRKPGSSPRVFRSVGFLSASVSLWFNCCLSGFRSYFERNSLWIRPLNPELRAISGS